MQRDVLLKYEIKPFKFVECGTACESCKTLLGSKYNLNTLLYSCVPELTDSVINLAFFCLDDCHCGGSCFMNSNK